MRPQLCSNMSSALAKYACVVRHDFQEAAIKPLRKSCLELLFNSDVMQFHVASSAVAFTSLCCVDAAALLLLLVSKLSALACLLLLIHLDNNTNLFYAVWLVMSFVRARQVLSL